MIKENEGSKQKNINYKENNELKVLNIKNQFDL